MLNGELVGRIIQRKREQKNLSQEVISGLAGIGRTHLSASDRGCTEYSGKCTYGRD